MVNPDGTVTFVTAAHPSGTVGVTVMTPQGTSAPANFSFVPIPAGISLTPNSGPVAGGHTVTVSGTDVVGATQVTFGGVTYTPARTADASDFADNGDNTLTLVTAPHAAGAVDVVVSNANGSSPPVPYTYVAVPAGLALSPNAGPTAGGQQVTLSGDNLAGATSVDFGGTVFTPGAAAAGNSSFTVNADGMTTLFSPAHAVGSVDVTVTTPVGTTPATAYAYVAAPAIAGLNPDSGSESGGNTVVISGTDLAGATGASVDGTSVPFTVNSDGTISITMPAHSAGSVNVVVKGPGGTSAPASYTYTAADPGDPPVLAMTGQDLPFVAGIAGIGLLLGGAGLLLFTRRRASR